uniref:C2H2-type domain-containing protein n=1 Tax=Labrus bergylta TaxID=56723 RepID=A0A3Q3ERX9_9LABR
MASFCCSSRFASSIFVTSEDCRSTTSSTGQGISSINTVLEGMWMVIEALIIKSIPRMKGVDRLWIMAKLFPADVQQLSVGEEDPHEQQEGSSSLDQEDSETVHIKEEQEELWSSQEGLEEADIKFPFTPVSVKSEDDEEKPQSSQLHHRHTEEMETGADGEDCGGAEPERDSDPERRLYPEIEVKTEDSSEPETEDFHDVWKRNRKHESDLNDKRTKTHCCSECGKTFSRKGSLSRHMILHSGEKPFSCSLCSKRFNQKHILTLHMAHHRGEKPLSCSVCDQRFSWPFQLQRHTRETSVSSSQCGKTFKWTKNVIELTRIHTEEKPFSCSECGKIFIHKRSLTRHMIIHRGEKPFGCSECGKSFNQKSYLASHMGNHDEEKPLSCSECGENFNCKGSLTAHMIIHTGEKPFSCSECGKRFNSKANVTRHKKVHIEEQKLEKPFGCSECVKTFKQKSHLTIHMAHHRGEKPFSCTVCDKRFIWTFQLKRHKSLMHHGGCDVIQCPCKNCGFLVVYLKKANKRKSWLLLPLIGPPRCMLVLYLPLGPTVLPKYRTKLLMQNYIYSTNN